MVMKSTMILAFVCALLASAPPLLSSSPSQVKPARAIAPTASQGQKPRESFVDSTLKRINPTEKDYGACIEESRRVLLTETIENAYFWSNILTLFLLLLLFLIVLYQRGLLKHRGVIYADTLIQYQSALARAQAHSNEAVRRNREFMEALRLATAPEPRKLAAEPIAPPSAIRGTSESSQKSKASLASSVTQPTPQTQLQRDSFPVPDEQPSNTSGVQPATAVVPGLDLVAQNNALQQQLGLTQDQVKQLRRQLSESERQLQAEKLKNRTLKGE